MLSWLALSEVIVLVGMIAGCVWLAWLPSPEGKEHGVCWACGIPGEKLYWHVIDEGQTGCNQRISYLIHPACVWLAEKQAGL